MKKERYKSQFQWGRFVLFFLGWSKGIEFMTLIKGGQELIFKFILTFLYFLYLNFQSEPRIN